ncbi:MULTISPECIES: hypothetical protein [unclassified Bradyrhizobium]|nr:MULTISPECIES: hypothetical protein [unclassified Bradyrhizobium]
MKFDRGQATSAMVASITSRWTYSLASRSREARLDVSASSASIAL